MQQQSGIHYFARSYLSHQSRDQRVDFFTAYSKIDFTESKYFNFKIPLKYIPVGRADKKPPLV